MTIDLGDPTLFLRSDVVDDPTALYDTLRAEAPVWRMPGTNIFVVSSPALIREATGRPTDFSSNIVNVIHDDGNGCPARFEIAPYGDAIHVLSTADPPLHTRHRKLLQPHLTPFAVGKFEPDFLPIVTDHLDRFLAAGGGDFVVAFSDPVPASAISVVVGLPLDEVPRIVRVVSDTGVMLDGVADLEGVKRAGASAMELGLFVFEALNASIAQAPDERTGLLAVFAAAVEREEISIGDATAMLVVLVSAGSETTSSLLATAVDTLARNPEWQQRLREHPDQIPYAIEDFLRDDGPFQFHYRYATQDTTLGGMEIPAQSTVMLMWAAANRPAPGTTHAPHDGSLPPQHYAFGKGMHFCIGAPVARLEAKLALEQLLQRTASFRIDPEHPPTRRPSIFIRRHASLSILVDR